MILNLYSNFSTNFNLPIGTMLNHEETNSKFKLSLPLSVNMY